MKFIFRWLFRLTMLVIVLVIGLLLLKDEIIRSMMEDRIRAETGLETRIGRFDSGLFTPTVTIENFKIYNTAEFGGGPMIDMPELHLEYDRGALFYRELKFRLVRLNLSEINVVENTEGRLNTDFLAAVQKKERDKDPSKRGEKMEFLGIDTLNLTLDKIRFTRMRQPDKVKEVQAGLENHIVTNVRSAGDLAGLFMWILIKNARTLFADAAAVPKGAI